MEVGSRWVIRGREVVITAIDRKVWYVTTTEWDMDDWGSDTERCLPVEKFGLVARRVA